MKKKIFLLSEKTVAPALQVYLWLYLIISLLLVAKPIDYSVTSCFQMGPHMLFISFC